MKVGPAAAGLISLLTFGLSIEKITNIKIINLIYQETTCIAIIIVHTVFTFPHDWPGLSVESWLIGVVALGWAKGVGGDRSSAQRHANSAWRRPPREVCDQWWL